MTFYQIVFLFFAYSFLGWVGRSSLPPSCTANIRTAAC